AAGSITASQAVAAKLGSAGRELTTFADSSFIHAMHITTLISAAITLLGAVVVLRWMPGRAAVAPAQQPPAAGPAVAERAVAEPAVAEPAVAQTAVAQTASAGQAAELVTADHAVADLAAADGAVEPVVAAEG